MHPYIEMELENGIKIGIEIMETFNMANLKWFDNTETVADVEKILRERNISYKKHMSQHGMKFAEPKSWYFRGVKHDETN